MRFVRDRHAGRHVDFHERPCAHAAALPAMADADSGIGLAVEFHGAAETFTFQQVSHPSCPNFAFVTQRPTRSRAVNALATNR
jgi:hypothetical protein